MPSPLKRLTNGDNAFGFWKIDLWPAMPPEAPVGSYVVRWKTRDGSEMGYSIHPTYSEAMDSIPFTTERTAPRYGNITAAR